MVRLVGTLPEELVWRAIDALSGTERNWTEIDDVERALTSTGSLYAHPTASWTDDNISDDLARALEHGTIEFEKVDGKHMFRSVPPAQHGLWTYKNTK
jgi:hypothetical protein